MGDKITGCGQIKFCGLKHHKKFVTFKLDKLLMMKNKYLHCILISFQRVMGWNSKDIF